MARKSRTVRTKAARNRSSKSSAPSTSRPARFTEEDRERALSLIMRGLRRKKVAEEIGCSTETLRLWVRRADKDLRQRPPKPAGKRRRARCGSSATADARPGSSQPPASEEAPTPASGDSSAAKKAPTAPHSPGSGLSEPEVSAILELRKRYPTMGPAQIRAQLKRFKGWRVAIRAIASVLRKHGYELEHRAGRPQEPEPPRSWEAPYRNAIWQIDFTEVRLPEGRRALGVVIDDFSRFLVGYALLCNPSSEDVVAMLQGAIRLHGKPEAIYTDRAGPFLAWGKPEGLQHYLQRELIDHHTTRSYRPQGRGKVEAVIATIKRELWEVEHFDNEEVALQRLRLFVERYNHHRAHIALDGLTPADRFFGRWEKVLEAMEAKSRKRQGLELLDDLSSELLPPGQTEVLRLVAVDGKLELRFFGHRVRLGEIES